MMSTDMREQQQQQPLKPALSRGCRRPSHEEMLIAQTRADGQADLMARAAAASGGHAIPRPGDADFYSQLTPTVSVNGEVRRDARATPKGTPASGDRQQRQQRWFEEEMRQLYGNRIEPTDSRCTVPRCVIS